MERIYYFAYGSNMDEERMMERGAKIYSNVRGVLKNYKLVFNKIASAGKGEGFANIEKEERNQVEGIIYEIDYEKISKLDLYEGVPKHYNRILIEVETPRGVLKCEVYIANSNMVKEGLKPERDYLNKLLKGKDFLSPEYYEFLKNTETID